MVKPMKSDIGKNNIASNTVTNTNSNKLSLKRKSTSIAIVTTQTPSNCTTMPNNQVKRHKRTMSLDDKKEVQRRLAVLLAGAGAANVLSSPILQAGLGAQGTEKSQQESLSPKSQKDATDFAESLFKIKGCDSDSKDQVQESSESESNSKSAESDSKVSQNEADNEDQMVSDSKTKESIMIAKVEKSDSQSQNAPDSEVSESDDSESQPDESDDVESDANVEQSDEILKENEHEQAKESDDINDSVSDDNIEVDNEIDSDSDLSENMSITDEKTSISELPLSSLCLEDRSGSVNITSLAEKNESVNTSTSTKNDQSHKGSTVTPSDSSFIITSVILRNKESLKIQTYSEPARIRIMPTGALRNKLKSQETSGAYCFGAELQYYRVYTLRSPVSNCNSGANCVLEVVHQGSSMTSSSSSSSSDSQSIIVEFLRESCSLSNYTSVNSNYHPFTLWKVSAAKQNRWKVSEQTKIYPKGSNNSSTVPGPNSLSTPHAWHHMLEYIRDEDYDITNDDDIQQQSASVASFAILGAKNVGKSTLTRFIANQVTSSGPRVFYLETDIGQPELTTSGFVSLHELRNPLLCNDGSLGVLVGKKKGISKDSSDHGASTLDSENQSETMDDKDCKQTQQTQQHRQQSSSNCTMDQTNSAVSATAAVSASESDSKYDLLSQIYESDTAICHARAFLGAASPGDCPMRYLKEIEYCAGIYQEIAKKEPNRPCILITNLPGWIQGLGFHLCQRINQIAKVTHLIRLDVDEKKLNDIYENENNPFSGSDTDSTQKCSLRTIAFGSQALAQSQNQNQSQSLYRETVAPGITLQRKKDIKDFEIWDVLSFSKLMELENQSQYEIANGTSATSSHHGNYTDDSDSLKPRADLRQVTKPLDSDNLNNSTAMVSIQTAPPAHLRWLRFCGHFNKEKTESSLISPLNNIQHRPISHQEFFAKKSPFRLNMENCRIIGFGKEIPGSGSLNCTVNLAELGKSLSQQSFAEITNRLVGVTRVSVETVASKALADSNSKSQNQSDVLDSYDTNHSKLQQIEILETKYHINRGLSYLGLVHSVDFETNELIIFFGTDLEMEDDADEEEEGDEEGEKDNDHGIDNDSKHNHNEDSIESDNNKKLVLESKAIQNNNVQMEDSDILMSTTVTVAKADKIDVPNELFFIQLAHQSFTWTPEGRFTSNTGPNKNLNSQYTGNSNSNDSKNQTNTNLIYKGRTSRGEVPRRKFIKK